MMMLTKERCPQCNGEADSSHVRLVRDSCGHRKCRKCLLKEETGCMLCNYTPVYSELRPAPVQNGPIEFESRSSSNALTTLTNLHEAVPTIDTSAPITSLDESVDANAESLTLSTDNDAQVVDDTQTAETVESGKVVDKCDLSVADKNVPVKKPPTLGLKEHIIFTPGNPPIYKCLRCKKSYNNRKAARYHNYCGAPNTEKPHTCSQCGQGFVTKGHLEYHIKSHTGSLPFTCKSCRKGFKQLSKLNRHLKSHDGPTEKPFTCSVCKKAFTTKQILKEHSLTHLKSHFVACPTCNKKLSSQACLRKHKKLHADPTHKCKDCGKKFPVKWSLEVHMKTHQRERKFRCKVCPRAFKMQSDLKRHTLMHQEDGEWECTRCNLIFRRRDNLVRHLKNIHPESPMTVSKRQGNEENLEGNEDDSVEKSKKSPTTVSQAVSVIRAVPVIQKAKTSVPLSSVKISNHALVTNQEQEWSDLSNGWESSAEISAASSLNVQSAQVPPILNQNFHRESVVHYGSSSLESSHDVNSSSSSYHEDSNEVPYRDDQIEKHFNLNRHEEHILQNNAVPRPLVIVAKEACL